MTQSRASKTSRESEDTFLKILAALVVITLSACLHVSLLSYADDDAYIHMRVAKNLWDFGEPYFNRSDPAMASTSPLWVLLISPTALFGGDQALLVAVLNSVLVVIAGMVWSKVFCAFFPEVSRTQRVVAAAVTCLTLLPSSVGLMETPLAMCLVSLGYMGCLKARWWGASCFVAAVFVRPETIVYGLVLCFLLRCVRSRDDRSDAGVADLVIAALFCLALVSLEIHFFGSIVPHTASVKSVVYNLSTADFIRLLCIASYGNLCAQSIIPPVIGLICIGLLVCISKTREISLKNLFEREALFQWIVLLLPALLILMAYAARHVFVFPWYSPLFLVPIHVALLSLFWRKDLTRRLVSITCLVPFVVTSVQVLSGFFSPLYLPFFEAGARARQLRVVGSVLERYAPEAKILAPEVGALGYEFSGPITDAVGLATPRAVKFHPLSVPGQRPTGFHGGVPAAFVAEEAPDFIVGLDALMRDLMLSPQANQYEVIALPPVRGDDYAGLPQGTVFGSANLLILIRRELASDWSVERFSSESIAVKNARL